MNTNKEPKNKSDVFKVLESLVHKVQATHKRFNQESSIFSNELQDINNGLKEIVALQNQNEAGLKPSANTLTKRQFNKLLKSEIEKRFEEKNDVWLFDPFLPTEQIPFFIPISARPHSNHTQATRFISFINFKGGVGKTTLTANLATAFATGNYHDGTNVVKSRNLRVLVVDLDFQGTLSDRCAENRPLMKATNEGKTTAELLTTPSASQFKFEDLTVNFEKLDSASIIPAGESLDLTDSKHFVSLAFGLRDIRYCHRLWFHNPQVFNSYDLVLFDCPPRKTVSSICALTASDYVFIPTAPEAFDINSVNRTINWLINFRHCMNIPLKIGGVIFNRTQYQDRFTPSETDFMKKLLIAIKNDCSGLNSEVKEGYVKENGLPTIFRSFVPKRSGANYINGKSGELLPGAFEKRKDFSFFTDVATEMYERIYQ